MPFLFIVGLPDLEKDVSGIEQRVNAYGAGRIFPSRVSHNGAALAPSCPSSTILSRWGVDSEEYGSEDIWWNFYNTKVLRRRK